MKKLLTGKVIASTMVVASILSMTAIAADKTSVELEPLLPAISVSDEAVNDSKTETKYQMVNGKVESVTKEDGYVSVKLTNDNMGMVCNVEEGVFVIDQKDGSYKNVADLTSGMEITAILRNNSPMTMSIPPMTNGVDGFVIRDGKNSLDLSIYNDELTNAENSLKLNVDKETKIVDITGSKKVFTEADIKNSECLVIYGATTKSIPPQTSPDFVMILNNEELSKGEDESVVTNPTEEDKTIEPALLREIAEINGYTIKWESNDKPVIVENKNVKIELKVGSKICSINGVKTEMESSPKLENSKIIIDGDFQEVLSKYKVAE